MIQLAVCHKFRYNHLYQTRQEDKAVFHKAQRDPGEGPRVLARTERFRAYWKQNKVFLLSFFLPVAIMTGAFVFVGVYPFGNKTYLPSDMYAQYAPFFSELRQKLLNGESLFYIWNAGMGTSFIAIYAYYLSSPINWLLVFVSHDHITDVMDAIIVLKMGLSGLTFACYLFRRFRTRHLFVAAFAVFYALSSYFIAFNWNIMWLDCMVMLPLILLGLERLVQRGDWVLYCAALGFSIFSNYYISIMICIFCVLYFAMLLLTQRKKQGAHFYFSRILRFIGSSALAGGFAACLILPEWFALQLAASGTVHFPQVIDTYYSFLDLISRMMIGVEVQVVKGYLPNIYCTVAVFLLMPLYWSDRSIPVKEKIGKSLLLAFLLVSFNVNTLDFIWHGFHYPNCLRFRQSFIFIFLILTMSFDTLRRIKRYSFLQISLIWGGVIAILVAYQFLDTKVDLPIYVLPVTAGFLVCYTLLFLFLGKSKTKRKTSILVWVMLAVAVAEATVNASITMLVSVNRTIYIADSAVISELLEAATKEDTGFYRVEKENKKTGNDGAWDQFRSVSIFSSTANTGLTTFLGSLGLEHSLNKYTFNGHTPLTDALLSVKYLLYKEPQTEEQLSLLAQDHNFYLYKNADILPLGFLVDSGLEDRWEINRSNPFTVQSAFAEQVTGRPGLFEEVESTKVEGATVLSIRSEQTVFLYVYPNSEIQNITVQTTAPDGTEAATKTFSNLKRSYILNLGSASAGSKMTVTIDAEGTPVICLYAYSFNEEIMEQMTETLNEQPFLVESFSDTTVKGTITARTDGLLFTSIPYDTGWTAYVDGQKTEIHAFKDALVSVPVSAGTHTVEFSYFPTGLKAGSAISASCLLLFGLLVWRRHRNSKRRDVSLSKE